MKLTFDVPEELAEKIGEEIKAALDEYKKKQIWPKFNDPYYYMDSKGNVYNERYADDGYDKGRLSWGNCFKTQEEAEFKAEQLKVLHELEQLADDDQEWDGRFYHYTFHYSHAQDIIDCECWTTDQSIPNTYYFKSEKSALAAIDEIGKDRLKKYYFGVSE